MPSSTRTLGLTTLLLALAACGDDEPVSAPDPMNGGQMDGGGMDTDPRLDLGPGADAAGRNDVAAPDTGAIDAGLPDIGPRDVGQAPDLSVRFNQTSCAACVNDACPGTGVCLTAQSGESFCADRCDADFDGCVAGFTCLNISGEGAPPQYFCLPPGTSCRDGVGFGTPCFDNVDACIPAMNHCEGDAFAPGYCTQICATQDDCPTGYRCGAGDEGQDVCLSIQNTPAERCALADGRTACGSHHDCNWQDGDRCLRTTPALPGVCVSECLNGCAENERCARTELGLRCLPNDCACHGTGLSPEAPAETRNLLNEALAAQNLTRCDTIQSLADMATVRPDVLYDPYRLGFFESAAHEPLRAPEYSRALVKSLDDQATAEAAAPRRAAQMVQTLAEQLDRPPARIPPEALDATQPLVRAMEAFIRVGRGTPNTAAIAADAADLPPDLRRALARVVEGLTRGAIARERGIPRRLWTDVFEQGPTFVAFPRSGRGLDPATATIEQLLNQGIRYGQLFGGGADVLDAMADADLERFAGTPTRTSSAAAVPLFSQSTPYGRVIVGGPEPDIYDPSAPTLSGDIALLIDLGGDDVYRVQAGGNQSPNNPVSVLIDLGGDDVYGYVEQPVAGDEGRLPSDDGSRYVPRGVANEPGPFSYSDRARQGGARAGIAVHWDIGDGNDRYRSLRMSQGSGLYGTGVLIDEGGSDVYELEAVGQGAGTFGIGLLLDLGGNDIRRAYHQAQGFGYARGAGLAYDVAGDDDWLMNVGDPELGGDPLYNSAQRPGRANSTLGQGFGFGRRADFTDQAFFSGGLGLLVDAAGRDRYEGSIFAQGGGFWFGTGILADHEGDDSYDALWYAMGTGAHYALGLLLEGDGNDVYGGAFPRLNVTIAGAHDFTTAFLIDDAGNDIYSGSRITLGSGNVSGLGFFVDNEGDDQYDVRSAYSIGGAANLELDAPGSPRRKVKNLGVFIDAGGRDSYLLNGVPFMDRGDDMMWLGSENPDPDVAASELGTAIDGEGESTLRARP